MKTKPRKRFRFIGRHGYIYLYKPDHPNAYAGGTIMEHRWIMSQHLGRPLTKDELVHHINGDRQDNRIENLELTNRSEHKRIHQTLCQPDNLTKEQLQYLLDHFTAEEVSAWFGVERSVLRRWMQSWYIIYNRKGKFRKLDKISKVELVEKLKDNSMEAVAEMYGVNLSSIIRFIKENQIDRKPYCHCKKKPYYIKKKDRI